MKRFYYDLHIHSCLSPCGDDDNTPNNVAGMASINELDVIALTDHNTAKNCPAFFEACDRLGIVAIAGMELTTAEDIHVVCLFEKLSDALAFSEYVDSKRLKIKNRPEFFGEQKILDGMDNQIGEEPYLLSNATHISIEDAKEEVARFGGLCYPAHIDRDSNGIIAVLGTIPNPKEFSCYELHNGALRKEFSQRYGIAEEKFIVSSDAHYLTDLSERDNFFTLDCDGEDKDEVRRLIFEHLRG